MTPYKFLPRPIPKRKPERLAVEVVRAMDEPDRKTMLTYLLARWIADEQRAEAKRVERAASRGDRQWWRNRNAEIARVKIEDPAEYHRRYTIAGAIETFEREIRDEVRLEITAELLGTSFALHDGRMVTWGEATVEDHQTRLKALSENIIGNFTTMALHEQAIEALDTAGVRTLSDVPVPMAVAS